MDKLVTANIKSYTRFRLPQKCVALNDLCARMDELKVFYVNLVGAIIFAYFFAQSMATSNSWVGQVSR